MHSQQSARPRSRTRPRLAWGALVTGLWLPGLLVAAGAAAQPGPTVGELRAACERGIAAGNQGVDAAMCEWYAVPCDCKLTRAPAEGPRWCLPAAVGIDAALVAVTEELRGVRDAGADAAPVVAEILSRLYPCTR